MIKTFMVPKSFVLRKLLDHGPLNRRYALVANELPDEVELTEEFVRAHEGDMDWMTAVETLLEGEVAERAQGRYESASEALRVGIRRLQEEYQKMEWTAESHQQHEAALNTCWGQFATTVATIFLDGAKEQGGWDPTILVATP